MVKNEKITWPGWETVRLIGRGSFGAVYEIERDMLGEKEKAALKVITIPQSSSDIDELYSEGYDNESITNTFKAYLKSIVAEYSLMRKMNGSANVVNCDDVRYVEHDDGLGWDIYIKMELLTPLAKALGKEVSDEQVIRIGTDICKALMLCKKHNIIHRDIKPANIFISENEDYKLGDFGIAKTVEKTSGGTKIGTYEYMAPEVYHDQPYGSTADLYSLGMVLYWLLNERRTPFLKLPPALPTNSEKEQARKRRFGGRAIPAPVHGSEELKKIVLKACAFDPKERYQSAEEMLRDLVKLSGETVLLIPTEPTKTVTTISEDEDGTVGVFRREEVAATEDTQETTEGAFQQTHREEEEEQTVSAFAGGTTTQETPKPAKKSMGGLIFAVVSIFVMLIVGGIVIHNSQAPETSSTFNKPAATPVSTPAQSQTPTQTKEQTTVSEDYTKETEARSADNKDALADMSHLDAQENQALNEIKKSGVLTVALSPDFSPMEFVDSSKQGQDSYVGFDVTLAKYLAEELGVELEIQAMSFDACQTAVSTGNVPLSISGYSWTESRAENYELSDYYYAGDNETKQVILVRAEDAEKYTKPEDFDGVRVGAQNASLQMDLVTSQLTNAKAVPIGEIGVGVLELETGNIEALAVANGDATQIIANQPGLVKCSWEFDVSEEFGANVILIHKGEKDLLDAINAALAKAYATGCYETWYQEALDIATSASAVEVSVSD